MFYSSPFVACRLLVAALIVFTFTEAHAVPAQLVSRNVSLPVALDTPNSVMWLTSEEHPFTGKRDAHAVNGSSARVLLKPGQRSWLEAMVHGAGNFEFLIRTEDLTGLWDLWTIEVDGKSVDWRQAGLPARFRLFVYGGGWHRIRFTIHNPASSQGIYERALDDVHWRPAMHIPLSVASGLVDGSFLASGKLEPAGYNRMGRNGGRAIVLPPSRSASTLGMGIEGPCELSWDSEIDSGDFGYFSALSLEIDGVSNIYFWSHSWRRMRLTLPKGLHFLRWRNEQDFWRDEGGSIVEADHTYAGGTFWKICNMKIKPGISALADAVDAPTLYALELGDEGGKIVRIGGEKAWQPSRNTVLMIVDPSPVSKLSVRWGDPAAAGWGWIQSDGASSFVDQFVSKEPGWLRHVVMMRRGASLEWYFRPIEFLGPDDFTPPVINRINVERISELHIESALDSEVSIKASGWVGREDPTAKSDGDTAWSLIYRPEGRNVAKATVVGPAKVSCWWKKAGSGRLRLYVDGLPVSSVEPGDEWSRVELAVNPGKHVVKWVHAADMLTDFSVPGEAWLDDLRIDGRGEGNRIQFESTGQAKTEMPK